MKRTLSIQLVASLAWRVLAMIASVAFVMGPHRVSAQDVARNPEARAQAFVDLMADGQYGQAFELFTPQMKAAMPVERLCDLECSCSKE